MSHEELHPMGERHTCTSRERVVGALVLAAVVAGAVLAAGVVVAASSDPQRSAPRLNAVGGRIQVGTELAVGGLGWIAVDDMLPPPASVDTPAERLARSRQGFAVYGTASSVGVIGYYYDGIGVVDHELSEVERVRLLAPDPAPIGPAGG